MYWTKSTKVSLISNIRSIKRFEKNKKFFHCNYNSKNAQFSDPNYNKIYKVRPVMDAVIRKYCHIIPEQVHDIEKQIIPSKEL